jgi:hypothetical protein
MKTLQEIKEQFPNLRWVNLSYLKGSVEIEDSDDDGVDDSWEDLLVEQTYSILDNNYPISLLEEKNIIKINIDFESLTVGIRYTEMLPTEAEIDLRFSELNWRKPQREN